MLSLLICLITHLFCPNSTPRVLLSDNGAEFRNQVLTEICNQFGIKQWFTVSYHPASNGLVERANRKILDVLRPVVCGLVNTWEDWLPHVAASIICKSTGQSPHVILLELIRDFHMTCLTVSLQQCIMLMIMLNVN